MAIAENSRPNMRSAAIRYCLAALASVLALALRSALSPILGDNYPFQTAWVALVFSVWYCGVGPSLLSTTLLLIGVWYWFLPPRHLFDVPARSDMAGMVGFLFFSGVMITFGHMIKVSRQRLEQTGEALRASEASLKSTLQETEDRVQRRTAELEQKTAQVVEQARLLDLANDAIFVRTPNDRISYWNEGAERLYGWSRDEAVGRLTHELLRTEFPTSLAEIAETDRWEGELLQFKRDGSQITVASRWTTLRDVNQKFAGWLEICTDITGKKRAEEAARRLSGRILSLQDDERRRIARELHDSLGQYLVSLKVNLDILARTVQGSAEMELLANCLSTADECLSETRTLSHLLHPPLLDEAGFSSAARWYVEGFAQRSAFQVELDFPPELPRLDHDVEIVLFRVLQEGLTNVHRHSGASVVEVTVQLDAEHVQLEIRDNGNGIPAERLQKLRDDPSSTGVGLAGMQERARELGGEVRLHSSSEGTTIAVAIPIAQLPEETLDDPARGDTVRDAPAA
jgi:PAS domain S-box-containing protein